MPFIITTKQEPSGWIGCIDGHSITYPCDTESEARKSVHEKIGSIEGKRLLLKEKIKYLDWLRNSPHEHNSLVEIQNLEGIIFKLEMSIKEDLEPNYEKAIALANQGMWEEYEAMCDQLSEADLDRLALAGF